MVAGVFDMPVLLSMPMPIIPISGEVLAAAVFASALKVSMVLDMLAAGLKRERMVSHSSPDLWYSQEDLRIDNANHALLAMISLGAIVPDWLRVIDHDCVYGHGCGGGSFDRHEAREQAHRLGLHHANGLARLVESRLNNGVILTDPYVSDNVSSWAEHETYLWVEVKLYH